MVWARSPRTGDSGGRRRADPTPTPQTHAWHGLPSRPAQAPHLVVVAVGDGVGHNARLPHLQHDPHRQHRLPVVRAQLHQHPVAHLGPGRCGVRGSLQARPLRAQPAPLPASPVPTGFAGPWQLPGLPQNHPPPLPPLPPSGPCSSRGCWGEPADSGACTQLPMGLPALVSLSLPAAAPAAAPAPHPTPGAGPWRPPRRAAPLCGSPSGAARGRPCAAPARGRAPTARRRAGTGTTARSSGPAGSAPTARARPQTSAPPAARPSSPTRGGDTPGEHRAGAGQVLKRVGEAGPSPPPPRGGCAWRQGCGFAPRPRAEAWPWSVGRCPEPCRAQNTKTIVMTVVTTANVFCARHT